MRLIRYILWIFALLVLCVMGYILSLYLLIDANSAKSRISRALQEDLGYCVNFSSDLRVRLLPQVQIELPSAQLSLPDGTALASFRSANLHLNPLWFIFNQTHIQELKIDGLISTIELKNSPKEYLTAAKTDHLSLFQDTVIEHLILNDAEIALVHADKKTTFRNLSLNLQEPSPQMHGPFSLNAQMQLSPSNLLVDFQSLGELDIDLFTGQIALENISIHAMSTDGTQSLELTATTPLASITAEQFYANRASVNAHSSAYQHSAQIHVADFVLNDQGWQAPDLNLVINASYVNQPIQIDVRSPTQYTFADGLLKTEHIQGQIQLPDQKHPSALSGSLTVDLHRQIADFSLFGRLFDAPSNISGTLTSFAHPNIHAQITLGRLDLSALSTTSIVESINTLDGIKQNGLSLDSQTQQTRQSVSLSDLENTDTMDCIDFSWLTRFDFTGNIQIGELLYHKAKILQLKAPLQLNNGLLNIPNATALFYDGPLSAQASVSHQGFWNARIRSHDIQLDNLLSDLDHPYKAQGVAQIQTDLYAEEPRLNSVHGQFGFYLTRAKLFGISLPDAAKRIKQRQEPQYDPQSATEFTKIQGLARIKEGQATFSRLTASVQNGTVNATPVIDLTTQQVSGPVSGYCSGLKLSAQLNGPWYMPQLSLDYPEMLAQNHLNDTKNQASGWDKFKNFLKQRL